MLSRSRIVQTVVRAGEMHDAAKLLEQISGNRGPASKDEEKLW